jgi:hypothetical protein
MPTNLQIRRGLQSALPTGLAGEPLFTTDTKRLYISDGTATNLLQGAATLLTTGAIPFSDANGKLTMSASNLYWDNTNNRLGIGTASPTNRLDLRINSASATNNILKLGNTQGNVGIGTGIVFYADTIPTQGLFNTGRIYSDFPGFAYTSARMIFQTPTGQDTWNDTMCLRNNNVLIGTTTDAGFKLDVNGTARTGALTTTTINASSNIAIAQGAGISSQFYQNLNNVFQFGVEAVFAASNTAHAASSTSGNKRVFLDLVTFSPTSGTALYTSFAVNPTINQTGGANGITRGLHINPTLTAAADFRAIEVASGITILGAATTAKASLRIPSGTAPTSPVNGDIWFDGTNIQMRIGGVTKTFTLL